MSVSFKLTGVSQVRRNLSRLADQSRDAVKSSVEKQANEILLQAKSIVPVDTGNLRGSGEISIDQDGDNVSASISFNTDYAAAVHENTDLTGSKYLERPLRDAKRLFPDRVADSIKSDLG